MGRMDRVRAELANTILKLSAAIQTSQMNGKIPSDYSLGFANGAIFFEHMLNSRPGGPKFFERTASVGTLPVPVALRAPEAVKTEFDLVMQESRNNEVRFCEQEILTQSAGIIAAMDAIEEWEKANPDASDPEPRLIKAFTTALASVKKGFNQLDDVVTKHQEAEHNAKQKEQQNAHEPAHLEEKSKVVAISERPSP